MRLLQVRIVPQTEEEWLLALMLLPVGRFVVDRDGDRWEKKRSERSARDNYPFDGMSFMRVGGGWLSPEEMVRRGYAPFYLVD